MKKVKLKPFKELVKIDGVEVEVSDSGEYGRITYKPYGDEGPFYTMGFTPMTVYRVVNHVEKNLPKVAYENMKDLFEEV